MMSSTICAMLETISRSWARYASPKPRVAQGADADLAEQHDAEAVVSAELHDLLHEIDRIASLDEGTGGGSSSSTRVRTAFTRTSETLAASMRNSSSLDSKFE